MLAKEEEDRKNSLETNNTASSPRRKPLTMQDVDSEVESPNKYTRLEPFLAGKKNRHPFRLISPKQRDVVNYIKLTKEAARLGERKSCNKCFNVKEKALNMKHQELLKNA